MYLVRMECSHLLCVISGELNDLDKCCFKSDQLKTTIDENRQELREIILLHCYYSDIVRSLSFFCVFYSNSNE